MLTRFAPSPTGFLHIGNVRAAIFCYLLAKKNSGKFILRIDDTDLTRSKQEYVDAIKDDLNWLGISYEDEFYQSQRFSRYDEILNDLMKKGRVYKCFETEDELDLKRKFQLNSGKPPIYDRSALKLTEKEISEKESSGQIPHYRFLLQHENVSWIDAIKGQININPQNLSDPIIKRENGVYTYMLPSSIDDIDYNITHITRGEDHITNTAVQIQMMEALKQSSSKNITFAHLPLLKVKEGKLSKRSGSLEGTVKYFRSQNFEPITILTYLCKIGTSDNIEARHNIKQLIEEFDVEKFSSSSAIFDLEVVTQLNIKVIQSLSFDEVKNRINQNNLPRFSLQFWNLIKNNIESLSGLKFWHEIVFEKPNFIIDEQDKDFLKQAFSFFPSGKVDETTWDKWLILIKQNTSRKGKELFMPIRKALTGLEQGPEMKLLIAAMDEKVLQNIRNNLSK
jgi:glutamyl-tRNA synthetase